MRQVALLLALCGGLAAYERPVLDYSQPDPVVFQVPRDAVERLAERPSESLDAIAFALGLDAPDEAALVKRFHDWTVGVLTYDDTAPAEDLLRPGALDDALGSRRAVCAGYALLLNELCRRAGLECVLVAGHAKGDRSAVVTAVEAVTPNHAWNAVRCDGTWRLIDATWNDGAGGAYRTDWLFTDPALFARSHHPTDPRWQLLGQPLGAAAYAAAVPLRADPWVVEHLAVLPPTVVKVDSGRSAVDLPDPGPGYYFLARLAQGGVSHDDHALAVPRDGGQRLLLDHPGPGDWQATVFRVPRAAPEHADQPRTIADSDLFTLPLTAEATGTGFPRRFAAFNALSCTLISPTERVLIPGAKIVLSVQSPDRRELLVVDGARIEPLPVARDGTRRLLWQVQPGGETVHLAYRSEPTRLTTLLTWNKSAPQPKAPSR